MMVRSMRLRVLVDKVILRHENTNGVSYLLDRDCLNPSWWAMPTLRDIYDRLSAFHHQMFAIF